jgi:MoaA/NifB/PqqE/SkfB family radical SAM enzyme
MYLPFNPFEEYDELEEQCSNCPSRHICHKLSYCTMEEY